MFQTSWIISEGSQNVFNDLTFGLKTSGYGQGEDSDAVHDSKVAQNRSDFEGTMRPVVSQPLPTAASRTVSEALDSRRSVREFTDYAVPMPMVM